MVALELSTYENVFGTFRFSSHWEKALRGQRVGSPRIKNRRPDAGKPSAWLRLLRRDRAGLQDEDFNRPSETCNLISCQ